MKPIYIFWIALFSLLTVEAISQCTITLTTPDKNLQTVCQGTAIDTIKYSLGDKVISAVVTINGNSVPFMGMNATVDIGNATVQIYGTPTTAGVFNYSVSVSCSMGNTQPATGTITVGQKANITSSDANICENQSKTLSAVPAGGNWTILEGGGSITGNIYTPANVTTDTEVKIRYNLGAQMGCPASADTLIFTVNVFAGTADNTTSPSDICETGTKTLTGTPAGGTWSIVSGGGMITGTTYTPANVTMDTPVTIRYTIAANGACPSSSDDVTFTVGATPPTAMNTTPNTPICENQTKTLTGTPGGGTWSIVSGGGSISGNTYTPADITSNTMVTIRYSLGTGVICPVSTSDVTFTVNADPGAAQNNTSTDPICETQKKQLVGTPAGGTWSIASGGGTISGNEYTPPNVTTNTLVRIVYTIAANGACVSTSDDVSFMVHADPGIANNTTNESPICENQTKTLTATPPGGTWSVVSGGGTISGNTYTPDNITTNTTVTIRYTIAANGPCEGSSDDVTFTVNANPGTADNTTSTDAICENQTKTLTATPPGGTWSIVSGGGTITGNVYSPPNITTNTTVTIRYTIAANGACVSTTDDVTFTVNSDPGTADNTTSTEPICVSETKTLTATPPGGTWSIVSGGGSISGNIYSPPNVTTPTVVTIRYTIAANGACAGSSDDVTFTVNPVGTGGCDCTIANNRIEVSGQDEFCGTQTNVSITGTAPTPTGGTFEWSRNLNGGAFTPIANSNTQNLSAAQIGSLGLGVHGFRRKYTIPSPACSTESEVVLITIKEVPTINSLPENKTYCEGSTVPVFPLTGTPTGVVFNITGGINIGLSDQTGVTSIPSFEAKFDNGQPTTITVTAVANGCTSTKTYTITIEKGDPGVINITPLPPLCSNGPTQNLVATPAGGTWSGEGVTGNIFNPQNVTPGTIVVTYTVTVGSCTIKKDLNIIVQAAPTISFAETRLKACVNDLPFELKASPAGGVWSGPGVSGNMFIPGNAGTPGDIKLSYEINNGACIVKNEVTMKLHDLPSLVINTITPVRCFGESTGSIDINVTGAQPFEYRWNTVPVTITQDANNLRQGTYFVTITDNNSCVLISTPIVVEEPTELRETALPPDQGTLTLCNDEERKIRANVLGGNGGYVVTGTGPTGADLNIVDNVITFKEPGNYRIVIKDVKGCEIVKNIRIIVNPKLSLYLEQSAGGNKIKNHFCAGGSIEITATGATNFVWGDNDTSRTKIITAPGTYNISGTTIVNGVTCSGDTSIVIVEDPRPEFLFNSSLSENQAVSSITKCPETVLDWIQVAIDNPDAFTYLWDDIDNTMTRRMNNVIGNQFSVIVRDTGTLCSSSREINISDFTVNPLVITLSGNPIEILEKCFDNREPYEEFNIVTISIQNFNLYSNISWSSDKDFVNFTSGLQNVKVSFSKDSSFFIYVKALDGNTCQATDTLPVSILVEDAVVDITKKIECDMVFLSDTANIIVNITSQTGTIHFPVEGNKKIFFLDGQVLIKYQKKFDETCLLTAIIENNSSFDPNKVVNDNNIQLDSCGPFLLAKHKPNYCYKWYRIKNENSIESLPDTTSYIAIKDISLASSYFAVGRPCNSDCESTDSTIISTRNSLTNDDTGCYHEQEQKISVYPNPNNGQLTIELFGFESIDRKVSIYNSYGTRVANWSLPASHIDTKIPVTMLDLPSGVYLITASSEKSTVYTKMIIVK